MFEHYVAAAVIVGLAARNEAEKGKAHEYPIDSLLVTCVEDGIVARITS